MTIKIIQLTMAINFISSKPDSDETRIMHTKGNNTEIMIGSNTNWVIEELFRSLLVKYQENLEEKMSGSEFVFDSLNVLYYDLNKISLNRGGSYIPTFKWLDDKKATINPKNNDNKCFMYSFVIKQDHKQIKDHPERISNIKDWKKIESNNKSIALNTFVLKKYAMLISQNIIQLVKIKQFFNDY